MSATLPARLATLDAMEAAPPRAWWRDVLRRFARDRWALAATVLLVVVHLAAAAAPWLTAHVLHQSAYRSRIMDRVSVHGQMQDVVSDDGLPLGPGAAFPLGADALGRDVLSRILYGARISLAVATLGTLLAVLLGLAAGLLAGYYRGWLDSVISRFVDAMMAIPVLLLAIALAAVLQGGGLWTIVLILGLVNWTYLARLIRAEVLSLRERDFVEAARALGASDASIIVRHLLPSLTGPVVVFATLSMGGNILLESALSFLGVGIQPPTPSWGNMIQEGMALYNVAWWVSLFPGVAILVAVVCYNLVGEALKAALDPGAGPGSAR
jgi:peptide/nickel transport system permease protein